MVDFRIRRSFSVLILGLSLLIALIFISHSINNQQRFYEDLSEPLPTTNLETESEPELKDLNQSITLILVGDVMLNRGVEHMVRKYGAEDFRFPFKEIKPYLQKADILFGNLESIISDRGKNIGSLYPFRAEPEAMKGLKYAGFDLVSVANNHIFDYGRAAMEDSFRRLKRAGIDYVGGGFSKQEAYSPIVKEIEDTKIAFLAYTNLVAESWTAKGDRSGIAGLDKSIAKDIRQAKQEADLVVVSMHFGQEYQTQSNQNQRYFAHLAIDSGANLVVGHHPHVIQEVENYNQGYVAYSLGNFVFDQGFSEPTMKGLLLEVVVKDGKIEQVIPPKIKINSYFQPELAGRK